MSGAVALGPQVAQLGASARRSALRGQLDLLCARGSVVEAHLVEAWQAHNPDTEPLVGAGAATALASYLCTVRRLEEALAWAERAVAASAGDPAARLQALVVVALSLTLAGRGPEGLARLGELPAAAAEVPLEVTDGLVMRGMCRLFTDDLAGAMTDLSVGVARLRAGVSSPYSGQRLVYLSDAEYRLGAWDDALMHSALAVSLAHDVRPDLGLRVRARLCRSCSCRPRGLAAGRRPRPGVPRRGPRLRDGNRGHHRGHGWR